MILPQGEASLDLERDGHQITNSNNRKKRAAPAQQMPLFSPAEAIAGQLRRLDIPNLTPLEAINRLYQLQEQLREAAGGDARTLAED